MLTKLTFPGLDLFVDLSDVKYMERELRPPTQMILPNEKDYYTKIALSSGRVIACIETPEYIFEQMKGQGIS
ncbi:hypothetical protein UFOVP787_18 [uncultured Caudovirales phage]|uniref:Uncharacterized protein n=1 Tax=uncultured Caudovirales phage TaxID=2100421 RepID=A0A6J5NTB9_9CAUD|nr:hypothetical protein UFOVP787_18 [uncultured Caudovirales phage]